MTDLYQEIIIEEYKHPQNFGEMDDADLVLTERNSSCGDEVKIFLKFKNHDLQGKIIDIKWSGQGCAISMAATSVLSQKIKDEKLTLQEVKNLQQLDVEELLGLSDISPGRVKCLLIGVQAFATATKTKPDLQN